MKKKQQQLADEIPNCEEFKEYSRQASTHEKNSKRQRQRSVQPLRSSKDTMHQRKPQMLIDDDEDLMFDDLYDR
jgi:hypothetical protein